MANEQNLIPLNRRGKEEAKKIRQAGQRAQKAKQKEQKTYTEMAKAMLSANITDKNILAEMKAYGVSETDVKAYTLLGMIKASGNGNHNAFDKLMELTGEKKANQDSNVIAKLDTVLRGIDEVMDNE